MKSLLGKKLYRLADYCMSANRALFFIFIYEYPSYHFRGFFDGIVYLARSHWLPLPGVFSAFKSNFFQSLAPTILFLLRCHDDCRSFPSLYRKKRQSLPPFLWMVICLTSGSRQLYLCRDLTLRASFSGSSSAAPCA